MGKEEQITYLSPVLNLLFDSFNLHWFKIATGRLKLFPDLLALLRHFSIIFTPSVFEVSSCPYCFGLQQ